jgi:hypothetical protein
MIRVGIAFAAALLTGCTANVQVGGKSNTPASSAPAASAPESSLPSTNAEVCIEANNYIADRVKPTFALIARNNFNQRAARQLRAETTHLFHLSAQASGAAQRAIQREAGALTDLSIAMQAYDERGLNQSATRANSALAEFRGVCNV